MSKDNRKHPAVTGVVSGSGLKDGYTPPLNTVRGPKNRLYDAITRSGQKFKVMPICEPDKAYRSLPPGGKPTPRYTRNIAAEVLLLHEPAKEQDKTAEAPKKKGFTLFNLKPR